MANKHIKEVLVHRKGYKPFYRSQLVGREDVEVNPSNKKVTYKDKSYKELSWGEQQEKKKYQEQAAWQTFRKNQMKDRVEAFNRSQQDWANSNPDNELNRILTNTRVERIPFDNAAVPKNYTEIVDKISFNDPTGYCASLSLAYIGNKLGYDVVDHRGEASRRIFCEGRFIPMISKQAGGTILVGSNDFKMAEQLLDTTVVGKEYLFNVAHHVAIVRKLEKPDAYGNNYQYLEMQDGQGITAMMNGWHPLNESSLKRRFLAAKKHTRYNTKALIRASIVDIDNFKDKNSTAHKTLLQCLELLNTKRKEK